MWRLADPRRAFGDAQGLGPSPELRLDLVGGRRLRPTRHRHVHLGERRVARGLEDDARPGPELQVPGIDEQRRVHRQTEGATRRTPDLGFRRIERCDGGRDAPQGLSRHARGEQSFLGVTRQHHGPIGEQETRHVDAVTRRAAHRLHGRYRAQGRGHAARPGALGVRREEEVPQVGAAPEQQAADHTELVGEGRREAAPLRGRIEGLDAGVGAQGDVRGAPSPAEHDGPVARQAEREVPHQVLAAVVPRGSDGLAHEEDVGHRTAHTGPAPVPQVDRPKGAAHAGSREGEPTMRSDEDDDLGAEGRPSEQPPDSEPPPRGSEPPRPSEPPPDDDGPQARRHRLERMLRETVRHAIERGVVAGIDTISKTDKAIRGVVDDVRLPREVVGFLFSQIDETKNSLVRVVAREVRDFLEATDLAAELQRALTSLSFEIRTEVRFIPNEAGTGVKPSVRSRAVPRRRKRAKDEEEASDPMDHDGGSGPPHEGDAPES